MSSLDERTSFDDICAQGYSDSPPSLFHIDDCNGEPSGSDKSRVQRSPLSRYRSASVQAVRAVREQSTTVRRSSSSAVPQLDAVFPRRPISPPPPVSSSSPPSSLSPSPSSSMAAAAVWLSDDGRSPSPGVRIALQKQSAASADLAIMQVEQDIDDVLELSRQRHTGSDGVELVDRLTSELARAQRVIQILKRQEGMPSPAALVPLAVRSARFQAKKQSQIIKEKTAQIDAVSRDYAALVEENTLLDKEVQSLQEELRIKTNLVADWQQNYDRATHQLEELRRQLHDRINETSSSTPSPTPSTTPSTIPSTTPATTTSTTPSTSTISTTTITTGKIHPQRHSSAPDCSDRNVPVTPTPSLSPTTKRTTRSSSEKTESKSEKPSSFWSALSPRRTQSTETMEIDRLRAEVVRLREAVDAHQRQNALLSNELIRLHDSRKADDDDEQRSLRAEHKRLKRQHLAALVTISSLKVRLPTPERLVARLWKRLKHLPFDAWEQAVSAELAHQHEDRLSPEQTRQSRLSVEEAPPRLSAEENRPTPDTSLVVVDLDCESPDLL